METKIEQINGTNQYKLLIKSDGIKHFHILSDLELENLKQQIIKIEIKK